MAAYQSASSDSFERPGGRSAGIGDEDVDPAERISSSSDQAVGIGLNANVRGNREHRRPGFGANLARRLLECIGAPGAHHD